VPEPWKFASASALVFAAQSLNITALPGAAVSGHLLGGVLLAHWFGPAWGVLGVSLVLAVQSLLIGDGGWLPLGLNIINMAIIPAAIVYPMLRKFMGTSHRISSNTSSIKSDVTLGTAAWMSAVVAALVCSLQLLSRSEARTSAGEVVSVMLATHAAIGLIEALGTILCVRVARSLQNRLASPAQVVASFAAAMLVAVVAVFGASPFPDGLEYTLARVNLHEYASTFTQAVEAMQQRLIITSDASAMASLASSVLCTVALAAAAFVLAKLMVRPQSRA
jgi:cobalt/nickel transport system permease protein